MSPFTVKRCGVIRRLSVARSKKMRTALPPARVHHPKVVVRKNGEIVRTVYAR